MKVLKNKMFINYVQRLLIITALLSVSIIVFHLTAPKNYHNPLTFHLLGFFFLIMIISHYVSLKVMGNNVQKFIRTYMLSAVSRLMLYMIIILIYIFKNPQQTMNFVVTFFVFYVVFTTFEVREISKAIKKS
jgi:hypothetical protein